ncbi:MAG TPA: class I SAM-dependent methyltransferase [Solirubrobacteraceae bacterium]|jgi:SAM-dependent methyltransferase
MGLHPLARDGFRDVAEAYERGRPEYPSDVVSLLALPGGARVLDLAAGTGKLTRRLLEAGLAVVAVEPQPAMRARLPAAAEVLDGTAHAIPLPDASVAAVTVADAWHWFSDAGDEVARVVRPGGVVALLWQWPRAQAPEPWARALGELLRSLRPEHPAFGARGVPTLAGHPAFEPMAEHRVPFVHVSDREGVLAYVASISYVASRPDRDAVLRRVAALVPDGELRQPYETEVWLTRRRG